MRRSFAVVVSALALLLAQTVPARALPPYPGAPYAVPTNSWVGSFLFGSNGTHTGADLWGSASGAGSQGPSVYSAYSGYVSNVWWLCDFGGGVYETRNYSCGGAVRTTKYGVTITVDDGGVIHNWHMADQATFSSWVNPDLAVGQWRPMGTWLGWQGNATGVGTVLLHLHFTYGVHPDFDWWTYALDPSPKVGPNLRDDSPLRGQPLYYNGP